MRRIVLLALTLALLLVLPAGAEGNRLLETGEDSFARVLLAVGDQVVLSGDALYTWREGEDGFTEWTPDFRLDNPYTQIDDVQAGEGGSLYEMALFEDGGKLRGLRKLRDDDYETRAMQLFDVTFSEDGTVGGENAVELPMPGELAGAEWYDVRGVVCREGVLYMLGEAEDMSLCVMDLENPRAATVQTLRSWDNSLSALPDGALLATGADDEDGERLRLCRVSADGALVELCRVDAEAASVAADPDTGAVYVASKGLVRPVDLETGELGEAVAALPVGGDAAAMLSGGRWYAAAMENGSVAVLDTRNRLDEDKVLRISSTQGDQWINEAVIRFAVEHPEITPVLGYDAQDPLEAMMTQSADTDVYILGLTYSDSYRAMLERGFMLPLDGSETLSKLYGRFYPSVQPAFGRDGVAMALPVSVWGDCMTIDSELLEKLGLTMADVPDSWTDFLDFMEEKLRPRLDGLGEHESFTYDGVTVSGFRFFLFQSILKDWTQANRAAGRAMDYEDPRLVEALEKLDAIDFSGYGLWEDEEEEGFGYGWSDDTRYLVQFNGSFLPDSGYGERGEYVALGFGDELPGTFALRLASAFINPYSARSEAALTFLEALADALPPEVEYALCPDLNEPLKRDNWEKIVAGFEEEVAQLEAQVEAAQPSERQALEDALNSLRSHYEANMDQYIWQISEDRLTRYRAIGDRLSGVWPTWFEQDSEGWDLMQQYQSRLLSARDFLREVNKKARMMEMEQG